MAVTADLALTTAGRALKAKIEVRKIPLDITRIVTASGVSGNPLNLNAVVREEQQFTVKSMRTIGERAIITALITNAGLATGYCLSQIGFYATDPDVGEILYRISQFDPPGYVPADTERGWTYEPTFNFVKGNASSVNITIAQPGFITLQNIWESVEYSAKNIPDMGVKTHYFITKGVPDYCPALPAFSQAVLKIPGMGIKDAVLQSGRTIQDAFIKNR